MTKCLMIQGTASNAGKSLIVAALCRIYARRGYNVAPFKSQNMSLNSFTTKENKEIAIAQVLQAEAAMIEPTVDMNPILLKPKGSSISQVIIQGEAIGDKDFFRQYDAKRNDGLINEEDYRKIAKEAVIDSLDKLKEKYEIIIMEGAGSPAEINLREGDLANMGAAEIADADVLLVGDIDKGGVFASVAGTFMLLDDADRSRFKGVIINKFRGNVDLLDSGIVRLEEIIKVPVLGIVPYAENLNLPEEDSASLKEHTWNKNFKKDSESPDDHIIVGVVKLPKIANFTDIDPFEVEEDVEVRIIEPYNYSDKIKDLDALIIPGTRNSTEDMKELVKTGLADKIRELSKNGTLIVGICGGYQILGNKIIDKNHKESKLDEIDGLGLLSIESEFVRDTKIVKQSLAKIDLNCNANDDNNEEMFEVFSSIDGEDVTGYELHEGTTNLINAKSLFKIEKGIGNNDNDLYDGAYNDNVFGTYFHGIFNNYNIRREFLNHLRKRKGLEIKTGEDPYETSVERSLEELANIVEETLDMDYIDNLIFND